MIGYGVKHFLSAQFLRSTSQIDRAYDFLIIIFRLRLQKDIPCNLSFDGLWGIEFWVGNVSEKILRTFSHTRILTFFLGPMFLRHSWYTSSYAVVLVCPSKAVFCARAARRRD